jgi:Ala-tRNA(Pro) deacylase
MRITELLAERRLAYESQSHAPAFTAQMRAKYLHVPGSRVAKAVLLFGPQGPLLAVLPACRRLNLPAIAEYLGGPVRLATDDEVGSTFPDCEWGVVPPFGVLYGLPSLLDDTFQASDRLVFKAHTHVDAVWLSCRDFEQLERPRRLALSTPLGGPEI